ncbi:MAG TPA: response regulator [Nitrospirae bacterium]|nr:sensor protein ZraS [bacterium BMS3Abin10]GBE39600.1 sensor protein ZraS [bacterium BMS3Bbin08]HDH51060.1 response regulator [Nitrospirota bacterium]HDK17593.1 response regulator [Nitrospirota bacterium]HDO25320.1 response regulator [Nitrospirota bacterium]
MKKLRVLVADDEQVIRELFEKLLCRQGYVVNTAVDGVDALEKVKRSHYDMLILDLKMPRMNGMEVLYKTKELKKDFIIIIITGYATIETAKEAIKLGCFDYITKPFDAEYIDIVIKRAVEMHALAERKRKLREQIRVAEKLNALAHMGAGVAHEVNTVLTGVKLFLEMLKPELSTMKKGRNITLVLEEVERAETLIRRFLTFSKPDKSEFLRSDINKVLNRSLELLKYRFKKQKIKVSNMSGRELPRIACDPAKIEEVFLNVISNSIDSMNKGGELVIRSEVSNGNAAIVISDTGTGIPAENMPKLSDPFFTTRPHGIGLGLSIVYRIIEDHKGTISVTSKKGKGTVVRVELPIEHPTFPRGE